MLAELSVRPGLIDDFLDYAVENLAACRASAGNLAFDVLIDETRPDIVVFREEWASVAAQQAYMAWRAQSGGFTQLLSFLNSAPKLTALRRIAD